MTLAQKIQAYVDMVIVIRHLAWQDRNLILAAVAKSLGLSHSFEDGKWLLETTRRGYVKTLLSMPY